MLGVLSGGLLSEGRIVSAGVLVGNLDVGASVITGLAKEVMNLSMLIEPVRSERAGMLLIRSSQNSQTLSILMPLILFCMDWTALATLLCKASARSTALAAALVAWACNYNNALSLLMTPS